MSVMESDKQGTESVTPPQHWRSCKLMIDPSLTKGLYKVYRYDGRYFNIPVEDLGLFPVGTLRDPRVSRLWSRSNNTELLLAKFKVDEWYVGPVPPKEVTFSRLNDNVKEAFLSDMCKKYGTIEEVEIFYNPLNKKHSGIGKVIFDTVQAAKDAVQNLHQTSVMGNIIHVEVDPKGENRSQYLQQLLRGLHNPWGLPVGSSEQTLQSLIDRLVQQGNISSPTSSATPLSMDTAYSSIWQDTPCSFGLTPHSQGTPLTPCLSATPLSQDSCYSSLQATPVLQGEPSSALSIHNPVRRQLSRLKPARYKRRSSISDVNFILKHCQTHPAYTLSAQIQKNSKRLELWGHNPQPSSHTTMQLSFNLASPCEKSEDVMALPSKTLPLKCNSLSILSLNLTSAEQSASSCPPGHYLQIREASPSAGNCSAGSPQPETESLDSRIENMLINGQSSNASYFDSRTTEADVHPQESPTSPCSDRASLSENEEDETTQAVLFLTKNSQAATSTELTDSEQEARINDEKTTKEFQPLSHLKKHHAANVDKANPSTEDVPSLCQPPLFPSHPATKAPHAAPPICPRPPPALFPFPVPVPPFPPMIPPVPPRLPNGSIPIPPPGWIPPPGHHVGISIPPPSIAPSPSASAPTTFFPPAPSLMAPPAAPPPAHAHPLSMRSTSRSDENPQRHRTASIPFPPPPWPAPPLPRFTNLLPPPGYVHEDPHKVTVDKVLEVLMDELKSVIKKDITRRMIEGLSFKAFEDWWDCQEKKTKEQVTPLKNERGGADVTNKPKNDLGHVRGTSKKPPLPSFKVKRKSADDSVTLEETETTLSSKLDSSAVKQGEDKVKPAPERLKRRHARPHELDSDDDDDDDDVGEKESEKQSQGEETRSDNVAAIVQDDCVPHNQCVIDHVDENGEDEEEDNVAQKPSEGEVAIMSHQRAGSRRSDDETFSDCSSSGESEYESSDFDSSDSVSSSSFVGSSSSFLSPEDEEDMEEDEDDNSGYQCKVSSSDEESMELEPSLNTAAPLTPGAQLDLLLQDWPDPFQRENQEENKYTDGYFDVLMELQTTEPHDLQPPSPLGLPVAELDVDVDMESPGWPLESLETEENLRPLTPNGCFVDSDPDLLIKSKPTSPAIGEAERPQTPGRCTVAELENTDSDEASEFLSRLPRSSEPALAPSDLPAASNHLYQEIPKTPGREERSVWSQYSSVRAPATPGRETTLSEGSAVRCSPLGSPPPIPSISNNPYVTAPKTPGRDIVLPRRAVIHRRKTLHGELSDDSPVKVSCSRSLSESSSDGRGERLGLRTKPLQGLENMPGLLGEEDSSLRRKHWRRRRRRWNTHHRQRSRRRFHHRGRSWGEERRILHSVWKEGLDEEDALLLQSTYERLQEQDNGFGWLSDALWIPHPLTTVVREQSEEPSLWPKHRTGSARTEGFYRISRKDKLKYLKSTQLDAGLPSTSTQGSSIPAQLPTSGLRAGSDFRSEQRRLLSSFSCDSDLVKFNQLKFRKKRIRFSRSHIHEWGLFAMEPIAADEMVIEYVGQIVRQIIADMREPRYEDEGIGSSYLFRVDQDTIIDATKCGNLSRFINHSCNPNCYAKIISVDSQKKIVIYSRQPININEEITYDYKFPLEETKIPCLCGAESCRGSLN